MLELRYRTAASGTCAASTSRHAAATRHGVAIATGSGSAPEDLFPAHVRLCFPAEPAVLEEGVRRLAAAWREVEAAHVPLAAVR